MAATRRRPAGQPAKDAAVLSERWYWLITPFVQRIVDKLEDVEHRGPNPGLNADELVRVLAILVAVEQTVQETADAVDKIIAQAAERKNRTA
jgi:hypothetical protein